MKKIIFKIAFSRKVGSGHLYRSSNLAQLLKDRGVETILILEKKNKVDYLYLPKVNEIYPKGSNKNPPEFPLRGWWSDC